MKTTLCISLVLIFALPRISFANGEYGNEVTHSNTTQQQIISDVSYQCRVSSESLFIYSVTRVDIIRTQAELEYEDITILKDSDGYTYKHTTNTYFASNPYKVSNYYISCPDSLGY